MNQSGIVWTSQSSKAIAERDKNKDNKNNNINEFTYKPKTNVKEKDKEFIAKAIKEKIESNKVINNIYNESKPLNIIARQNQATYNAHTKLTQSKSANLLTSNVVSMSSAVTYIEEIQESKKDLQRMVDRMYYNRVKKPEDRNISENDKSYEKSDLNFNMNINIEPI